MAGIDYPHPVTADFKEAWNCAAYLTSASYVTSFPYETKAQYNVRMSFCAFLLCPSVLRGTETLCHVLIL